MSGCRVLCGLCSVEIGDEPLDDHYETCEFLAATAKLDEVSEAFAELVERAAERSRKASTAPQQSSSGEGV